MKCGCFWNNRGFVVGRKWLSMVNAKGTTLHKIALTSSVREQLSEIASTYDTNDANRTLKVISLIATVKAWEGKGND